jgi:predicted DCC family thiol-disulfide oxidoreductase YuxK
VGTASRKENASNIEANEVSWPDDDVILYDGVCVFCSRWIRFIATRDRDKRFRFTAIQSAYGTRLAQAFGIDPDDPDTNAVIHGGIAYFKSDAALTVLSSLPGYRWTRVFFAVPKPLRNAVYNLVAKNRYRIFGKYEACFVPDADMRARVME